jgi:hypothetical protein
LGLPTGLLVNGVHLYIFFTLLVSGILFLCPNQLNLWRNPPLNGFSWRLILGNSMQICRETPCG